MSVCWGTSWMLRQLTSALAFTFCFHWAQRLAKGKTLILSQFLSEYVSSLEHACGFLNSLVYSGTIECPNFPKNHSHKIFFPGFCTLWIASIVNLCPKWLRLFLCLTLFLRNAQHFSVLTDFQVRQNIEKHFASVLQGAPRLVRKGRELLCFLWNEGSCTGYVGCCFK